MMYVRLSLPLLSFLFVPLYAHAHIPVLVEQTSLHDIEIVTDPVRSHAFYGVLDDFPHTYEIRAKESFVLRTEVLIPDTSFAKNLVSGIIIKETGRQGRVEEVTRMLAKDATWETFYEFWGGDSYRRGGRYEAELGPGVYRIEVSTPDNDAPYVLVIGAEEEWGDVGYFEMIGRIADVKAFFGKSRFMVIQSPLVYIPVLLVLAALVFLYIRKKRGVAEV